MRWFFGFFLLLAWPTALSAQTVTQVKPWFLLIVDTSSSMDACTTSPCGPSDPPNACGFRRNRLGDAKCAIQRIVASTGDAELALMQYAHPCNATCGDVSDGTCDAQLLVPLSDSNQPTLYQWVDGVCQSNCTGNNYTREIRMGNNTPIAASLERAHQYLAGSLPRSQVVGIANGGSPYPSPIEDDPFLSCRPVSVIMLTDGEESCGGDPSAEAAELFGVGTAPMGKRVRTYVIAFGVPEGTASIEDMAMAGGTDAPGPQRAFYAANEQGLSVALNQIIADSQLPSEICNGLDDNCNMLVDEGIQKYCDPTNIGVGPTLCEEPDELLCDGIDDDCDGIVDEGVSNACGVCGETPSETCDNNDNDCDGRIDEDVVTGEPCGTTEGSCQIGMTDCVDGNLICIGQLVPGIEICDCLDNDCDGFIDESFEGEGLCATGATCVACGCQTMCMVTEFSDVFCGGDTMPEVLDSGLCICIDATCDEDACAQETQERGGEVVCTPDSEDVTRCVCKAGTCVDACADVTCPSGQVCDPRDTRGACKPDNCLALGCRSDEVCNAVSGDCEPDLCVGTTCGDTEACRDGVCEPTCANVTCPGGERCQRGECVTDRCANASCLATETCDPQSGDCVTANNCNPICIGDATCNRLTGECTENPCRRVHCPEGTACAAGECVSEANMNDAGLPPQNVLAAGGGGCACTVAGAGSGAGHGAWWALLALFGLTIRRLHRRHPRAFKLLFIGALGVAVVGCDVAPFCVSNCEQPGVTADGGARDAQRDTGDDDDGSAGTGGSSGSAGSDDDSGVSGSGGDGGTTNCRRGATEICNGRDDDCDFLVDEEAFEPTSFCDSQGVCADDQLRCAGGAGWICRHSDDHEATETRCDDLDNDCDGATDEGTNGLGEECGVGIGACRVTGELVCSESGIGTRCSLDQPGAPGVEICDGIDNDCDGAVDEPKSAPGNNPSYVQEALVQIGSFWIYPYEASRPDASDSAEGSAASRACSKTGVLPWTNLTYAQARAACQAADMDLCTETQWETACTDGPGSATCGWSFTTTGNACGNLASNPAQCNGEEYDAIPATASVDDDAVLPTGSLARCFASTAGGQVFDLSGNVKELTRARSNGVNPVRGGSYNNVAAGLRCDFDFTVVNNAFKFQNVGFRCCSTSNPN